MEAVSRATINLLEGSAPPPGRPSGGSSRSSWQEAADAETQPLLPREGSSGVVGRRSQEERRRDIRVLQHQAAQDAAMELGWPTYVMLFLACCLFGFWFYVNVESWYILMQYYNAPCDQPLANWLLAKMILDALQHYIQEPPRPGDPPRMLTWLYFALQYLWLGIGYQWLLACKSCQETCPELFSWVHFLVFFGIGVALLLMFLPLLVYLALQIFVRLVGLGVFKNPTAAREDTLALLERIEYDPNLFAASGDANDNRPSGECCCCTDDFDAEKVIVRTPCKHYFHEECLGEWLKLARTCPICRCDLDVATDDARADEVIRASVAESATGALP